MPKRITYLEKRSDLSREAFRKHWSTVHAEIARDLPGVTAYRQNHVQSVVFAADPVYQIDGIVELWFATGDDAKAGFGSDVADRLIVDERRFLSGLTGGAMDSGEPYRPWRYKLWVLVRWAGKAQRSAITSWVADAESSLMGGAGSSVNILDPDAPLLLRAALRHDEAMPQVAIVFGFDDLASAEASAPTLVAQLERLDNVCERTQLVLAEEVVII